MTDPGQGLEPDVTQRWGGSAALPPVPPRRSGAHRVAEAAGRPDGERYAEHDLAAEHEVDAQYDDALDDDAQYDDALDDDALDDGPAAVPARRRRDPLWQVAARGVGELMVTVGVVLLLFVVYEVYVTDWLNDRTQSSLDEQIRDQWEADGPTVAPGSPMTVAPAVGEPLAVLHVPRLGEDYTKVVLEGTDEDQLRQGPGHYVDTALPGQAGNLAIAGHRVGKGSPFLDADTLVPGDAIVVETADSWFTYRVLGDPASGDYATDPSGIPGQQIVTPTDVGVIAPVPGAPGVAPTGAYLTLTTCHPKYSARQRMIVHAVLEGAGTSKAAAPDGPPALQED
ncbi:class E sortase [Modestobacter versicolor]|uniref:class E sortase n=1 Tax=Modestobacter versicolor TaxID=429133 RepID=UPI0034DF6402